jgi:hypothetical protein
MMTTIRTCCVLLFLCGLGVQGHTQGIATSLPPAEQAGYSFRTSPATREVRQQFIGHWRLAKFENFDDKGVARDAGYAGGRIMYDAAGNMSAQLMRIGRKLLSQPATEPERAAAYSTYTAYYGKYTVDPSAATVTHAVEGAANPNWVNTNLVRYYEFSPDGKQLKLSLRNAQGRVTGTLTWLRIE